MLDSVRRLLLTLLNLSQVTTWSTLVGVNQPFSRQGKHFNYKRVDQDYTLSRAIYRTLRQRAGKFIMELQQDVKQSN